MKSPFPGMDPYLERHWLDVHTKLVAYAADVLNTQLPDDLIASTEERVAIESGEDQDRVIGPDVRIIEPPADETAVADVSFPAEAIAPYRLSVIVEPITERFIRIIEAGEERLVTVIEYVSPTNKRGDGLAAFRDKRADLVAAGVNFVEVDLVRTGNWRGLLRPFRCPTRAVTPYRATFRLPHEPGFVWLYPIHLRDRLPAIAIPLRSGDPRVQLDLQELLDRAYANGRYARRINYSSTVDPPLEPPDAAWADELLRGAGKR